MKTVTVKGIGRVSAPVDTVELSFRLWAKDKNYDAALEAAAEKVDALERALEKAGFSKEDYQTAGFHVNTEYESVQNKNGVYQTVFSGYNCSYDQLLRFDFDTERLGVALAAVAESKAQPELNVNFTVKEPEKLEEALLQSAAENAKKRAEVLCRASGVKMGELQRIDYEFGHLNFRSETMMTMEDCAVPALGAAKRSMAANLRPKDIELQETAVFMWEITA